MKHPLYGWHTALTARSEYGGYKILEEAHLRAARAFALRFQMKRGCLNLLRRFKQ